MAGMARPRTTLPTSTLGNGRYELIDSIGTGGMATVYRARDHWYGVERAIKLLAAHNAAVEKTRTRFVHEARTMAQLDHPNIARIFDIGDGLDDHWYFVMEYAPDGSLASFMRRHGPCPPHTALQFVYQMLRGLDHAHTAGVVHRDVKPHNMVLDGDRILLTDFGIARVMASEHSRITGTGDVLGTLAYMSPEQRIDPRNVGPSADLYGVGATLYILVTGRRPFDLAMAALDPFVLDRLPLPLRSVVRRATAHLPDDRYQSAREMAEAICEAWEHLDPDAPPVAERMSAFSLDHDPTIIQVRHPTPDR